MDLLASNWKVRRPLVLATLSFCAAQLTYLTVWGQDTGLAQTMAIGAYGLAGSTLGSYLFAATWDTKNIVMAARPQPNMGGYPGIGQPVYDSSGQPAPGYAQPAPLDDRPR